MSNIIFAYIGTIARVWPNTPNELILPCVDDEGRIFELLLKDDLKETFERHTQPVQDELSVEDEKGEKRLKMAVSGTFSKRMWVKRTGGWGHTWRFTVEEYSHETLDGDLFCARAEDGHR